MIKIHPFNKLGEANHGWLHARYHFSFSSYYNPERMGFGILRVINDDEIKAGQGFPPHSHQDMEIITYVRDGAVMHKDSLGNDGITSAGDVQVMSAGDGNYTFRIQPPIRRYQIVPNLDYSQQERREAALGNQNFPQGLCR